MDKNKPQTELRKCPFCGGPASINYDDGYFIMCKGCGATGPEFLGKDTDNKEKHIKAWNSRPS